MDKRRRALADQQRREHEERERKEREEQERKEKIREEQDRRRQAEYEKQIAKQREIEMVLNFNLFLSAIRSSLGSFKFHERCFRVFNDYRGGESCLWMVLDSGSDLKHFFFFFFFL